MTSTKQTATDMKVRSKIILDREDIRNPLHPHLFDQICEDLGLDPKTTDQFALTVTRVEVTDGAPEPGRST